MTDQLITTDQIAKITRRASREIAATNDVRLIAKTVDGLDRLKKIVGAVTGRRADINRIADPMVEGIVKAGRILREMGEKGQRDSGKGNRNPVLKSRSAIPKLADLGFSASRASRWQLASDLPTKLRAELKEKVLATDDGLWSLGEVLRAAKHWIGERQRQEQIEPTAAKIVKALWEDWLPKQPDCDLLLTDPPYSTEIEDITAFAAQWVPVALQKIKPTGRGYICIGAYPRELHAYLSVPPPSHLCMSQVLVWTYRNRVGPSPTFDYKLNWQAVLYYRGTEAPPLNCARVVSDYPDLNDQFSVQEICLPDARRNESWHAWQKPTELCEQYVRNGSQPGNLVLDPFAGTGSFLLAAGSLGRKAFGCDKDADMVKIAKQRGCS